MSNEIRLLIRKRDRLHAKFRRTRDQTDANAHYLARREVDRAKANAKERYRQSTIQSLNSSDMNIRTFWTVTKRHIGNRAKSQIPPLKDGNCTISDNDTKTRLFNTFFAQQCKIPDDSVIPVLPQPVNISQFLLCTITTTTDDVLNILKVLNVHKSSGPDGIIPFLLRYTRQSIAQPLCRLFNYSLTTGVFQPNGKFLM
jgi:hypothetical protein